MTIQRKQLNGFTKIKKRLGEPASLATEDNVVLWALKNCKKEVKTVSVDELMAIQPNG